MSRRCDECGRFLPATATLACWRVQPDATHRQTRSIWNYYARWRCDVCRLDKFNLYWLQPTTLATVMRLRGPGHQPPALPSEMETTR